MPDLFIKWMLYEDNKMSIKLDKLLASVSNNTSTLEIFLNYVHER